MTGGVLLGGEIWPIFTPLGRYYIGFTLVLMCFTPVVLCFHTVVFLQQGMARA
jgi:hypothetical protein